MRTEVSGCEEKAGYEGKLVCEATGTTAWNLKLGGVSCEVEFAER